MAIVHGWLLKRRDARECRRGAFRDRSFANSETERIWNRDRSRKLPPDLQQRAMRRLTLIDSALSLDELGNLPGNRLHALKDDRAGQHPVSINMQWRICFVWKDGDAHDVEITD